MGTTPLSSTTSQSASLKEVVDVLITSPRLRVHDVQPFLRKWRAERKRPGRLRPLPELIKRLQYKVIRAAEIMRTELEATIETAVVASSAPHALASVGNSQPSSRVGDDEQVPCIQLAHGMSELTVGFYSVGIRASEVGNTNWQHKREALKQDVVNTFQLHCADMLRFRARHATRRFR